MPPEISNCFVIVSFFLRTLHIQNALGACLVHSRIKHSFNQHLHQDDEEASASGRLLPNQNLREMSLNLAR